jgi:hypothetical protein
MFGSSAINLTDSKQLDLLYELAESFAHQPRFKIMTGTNTPEAVFLVVCDPSMNEL